MGDICAVEYGQCSHASICLKFKVFTTEEIITLRGAAPRGLLRMNLCKWAFSLLFWAFLILLKQHVTQHVNDKLRPCFTHVGPKNGLIEKCLTAFHMFHPSPCFTHVGLKNRHIEKLPHNISHVPPKFLSLNWSKDMFQKNYKTWPLEMSHSISSHFYHQCFAHVDLRRTGL